MPVIFTFDIDGGGPGQTLERSVYGRIQSLFQRVGWENLGGTSYRYPRRGSTEREDWFNHVIPALWLFRGAMLKGGLTLKTYTLDAHSSTYGLPPVPGKDVQLFPPTQLQFGEAMLRGILDTDYPYPVTREPMKRKRGAKRVSDQV